MIVLLGESLRLSLGKVQDTKLARENRTRQLLSQVHVLSSWAFKSAMRDRSPQDQSVRMSFPPVSMDFDEFKSIFSAENDERELILNNAAETLKRSVLASREFPQGKYKNMKNNLAIKNELKAI